jgi:hypothetical protein
LCAESDESCLTGLMCGWLENYPRTTLAERFEIQEAVVSGRAVRDPWLRAAACGLAAEMLNGRLLDRDRVLLAGAVGAVSSGVVFVLIHASGGGSAFLRCRRGAHLADGGSPVRRRVEAAAGQDRAGAAA